MDQKSAKGNVLTDGDLDNIAGLLDDRMAPLSTKVDNIKDEVKELKKYVNEGFETVMTGIEDLSKQLAEKEKVERLVEWAKEASKKIGIKIDI